MPKDKTIHVEYSDFDEPVRRIEELLEYYLKAKDQKKLRIDEKHIIGDGQFQDAIRKARQELHIEYNYLDYEDNLDDWVVELVSGKSINKVRKYGEEYNDCLEKYDRVAWTATENANLPYGWHQWVKLYIAMDKPPDAVVIEPEVEDVIEVIGIDKNSLVLRLNKGLKADEYRNAWKAFSQFLKEPSEYQPRAHILKNKIYLDRRKGMTIKQIADKYFPNEAYREATYSKVKKIIKRFKS